MPNEPSRLVQPTSRNLLGRLLEEPDLLARIQALPPAALGKLIDRVGLEDAGEIVALATTDQIAHVFDDDLWKNDRPGEEERFDAGRFVVWLQVLLEAGDAFAAKRLAELPEDLVTLALHRHVLVIDLDTFAAQMAEAEQDDAERTDKALEGCLHEELDSYMLVSRGQEGWDSVLAAILALDRDHHAFLVRVLDRCMAMTEEYIESNGGLYEVLTSEEMLESDLAGDREDRRAESGYVAPAAAASFLALARTDTTVPPSEHDAVTRAYFRNLKKTPAPDRTPPRRGARPGSPRRQDPSALTELLRDEDASAVSATPHLLPAGPGAARTEPLLAAAMRRLSDEDPALFAQRAEELVYLTNVLVAGWSHAGRRLRPVEAASLVMETCSLGLSLLAGEAPRRSGTLAEQAFTLLRAHPADGLFRVAWRQIEPELRRRGDGAGTRRASPRQDLLPRGLNHVR